MSHEQIFSETLKDYFLINFHKKDRDETIMQGRQNIIKKLNFYSDLNMILKELDKVDVNYPDVLYKF